MVVAERAVITELGFSSAFATERRLISPVPSKARVHKLCFMSLCCFLVWFWVKRSAQLSAATHSDGPKAVHMPSRRVDSESAANQEVIIACVGAKHAALS